MYGFQCYVFKDVLKRKNKIRVFMVKATGRDEYGFIFAEDLDQFISFLKQRLSNRDEIRVLGSLSLSFVIYPSVILGRKFLFKTIAR